MVRYKRPPDFVVDRRPRPLKLRDLVLHVLYVLCFCLAVGAVYWALGEMLK